MILHVGVGHKADDLSLKNITVVTSKEVKKDVIWQNLLRKAMAQKELFCHCCK
jgi:hypothetical protein